MLNEVAAWLEAQGVGVVGTDIFRHRLPDDPDKAMVLTPYAGSPGPRVHDAPQYVFRVERLQVMTRAASYAAAVAFANAAYAVLWLNNVALGAVEIVKSEPLQPPFDMPEDEQNRSLVVFNVEIWSA